MATSVVSLTCTFGANCIGSVPVPLLCGITHLYVRGCEHLNVSVLGIVLWYMQYSLNSVLHGLFKGFIFRDESV